MADLLKTALIYDFDGTLARGNMQEVTFIPWEFEKSGEVIRFQPQGRLTVTSADLGLHAARVAFAGRECRAGLPWWSAMSPGGRL